MKTIPTLVLLVSLICVASCAHKPATVFQTFPPAADLRAESEPRVGAEVLVSEKAANDYSADVLVWGRGLAGQVGRVCAWAKARGMTDAPC